MSQKKLEQAILRRKIYHCKLALDRSGHVAVTWKDATIIWGGQDGPTGTNCDPSSVITHLYGEWTERKTSGDVPTNSVCASASVLNDKMYILGGNSSSDSHYAVYSLDLNNLVWTRLITGGTSPARSLSTTNSWVYQGNIYIFGGCDFGEKEFKNQLFCYTITTNVWNQVNQKGDIPCKRYGHSTTISGSTAFLFGGVTDNYHLLNDLYMLDMVELRWKRIHGPLAGDTDVPCARIGHSMTQMNKKVAVVYGGWSNIGEKLGDCWVLDLNKAKQLQDPSSIWSLQSKTGDTRAFHASVLEPTSLRLWLIGGDEIRHNPISKITINVAPLKILAMESVISGLKENDPRLGAEKCPKTLRDEIEKYRNEFGSS